MTTITTRNSKGSALTNTEFDNNLVALNTYKLDDADTRSNIRPSLIIDFADQKTIPANSTFTRSSNGTFYDGRTTVKAEENLATYSEQADQWPKSTMSATANAAVAPDGNTTADLIYPTSNNGYAYQNLALSTTDTNTVSIFAKAAPGFTWLEIGRDSTNGGAWFDLANGLVGTVYTGFTATIAAVGNGWYRCTLTGAFNTYVVIKPANGDNQNTNTASGTNGLYVWGLQVEKRAYATAYTPTTNVAITNYIPVLQTAQANTARFDVNPVTGESLGLLMESQATNLLSYSNELYNTTGWTTYNGYMAANCIISPDGSMSGHKLVADTTNSAHYVNRTTYPTISSGVVHTLSIYAKPAGQNWLRLQDTGSTGAYVDFNLSTLTMSVSTGLTTGTITPVGDGWYRCSCTYTSTSTNASIRFSLNTGNYIGDNYSGVFLWGAQLETGSIATTYIPTPLVYSGRGSVATYIGDNGLIQTAPANTPRYQRNAAGGQQLLLEGAGTNLLAWTQQFNNSVWNKGGLGNGIAPVVNANQAVAPDGTMTADLAVFVAPASGDRSIISQTLTTTAASVYTGSLWVKAYSSGDVGKVLLLRHVAGGAYTNITLTAVWQRVGSTETSVNNAFYLELRPGSGSSSGTVSCYLWGAQLELGSVATSYIPSTETFTGRSGTATYFDSGTTALAEQNLFPYSQTIDNAYWRPTGTGTVSPDFAVAPDGTMTAERFLANAGSWNLIGAYSQTTALPYTVSVYVKSNTGSSQTFRLIGQDGSFRSTDQTATTAWQRFSFTFTTVGSGAYSAGIGNDVAGTIADLLVWGFQLEQRASATAYNVTTSAAITNYQPRMMTAPSGLARYDFDPVTRLSKGLLVEAAGTNLLLYSSSQNGADWVKNGCSIAADVVIAPDGTLTADAIIEDTSTGNHRTYQSVAVTSGATYTASLYVKAKAITQVSLMETTMGGALFNLNALTASAATPYTITPVGNGWYRLSITITPASTSLVLQVRLYKAGEVSYTGDGLSGLYVWGAQCELGSVATSYIPTTSAQVTRVADTATSTAMSRSADVYSSSQTTRSADYLSSNNVSWLNPSEGTFLIDNKVMGYKNNQTLFSLDNGVSDIKARSINTNTLSFEVGANTAAGALFPVPYDLLGVNNVYNDAFAYSNNDIALAQAGGIANTKSSAIVTQNINRFTIGGSTINTGRELNGTIKRIAYYPKRLSNTQISLLTQ